MTRISLALLLAFLSLSAVPATPAQDSKLTEARITTEDLRQALSVLGLEAKRFEYYGTAASRRVAVEVDLYKDGKKVETLSGTSLVEHARGKRHVLFGVDFRDERTPKFWFSNGSGTALLSPVGEFHPAGKRVSTTQVTLSERVLESGARVPVYGLFENWTGRTWDKPIDDLEKAALGHDGAAIAYIVITDEK